MFHDHFVRSEYVDNSAYSSRWQYFLFREYWPTTVHPRVCGEGAIIRKLVVEGGGSSSRVR
jgi:hypothetical protein